MVIVPVTLNSVQFWVQDNFLKAKEETKIKVTIRRRETLKRKRTM